jgi:pyruvate dehydrogenase E2 component (dihydrolipoamide acetyltransferase)
VLAASHGIDLRTLRGSGPDGRIIERDVQRVVEAGTRGTGAAAPARSVSAVPAAVSARLRAVIARRMTESLQSTAQLTLTTEADMAEAARLRDEVGAELERRGGVRPTYTDLIVRAAAIALRDHPRLNARWTDGGARLLPEIHVGVAVALDEGLVVPVIRHADRTALAEISTALRDLSERARTFRLAPAEMDGGTFTVTNLGMYDVDVFTPILNPPEAAILGAGRVHRRPVAVGDRVEVRPVMVLSLTFDHRVVDGAPAAQFLQRVKHVLEHPYLLLLP